MHPLFVQRQADKAAAERREFQGLMVAEHAERVAAAEFERVARFYDAPAGPPVDVAVELAARTNVLFRP